MANLPNQNKQNPSAENDMPPVKAKQKPGNAQRNQNARDTRNDTPIDKY